MARGSNRGLVMAALVALLLVSVVSMAAEMPWLEHPPNTDGSLTVLVLAVSDWDRLRPIHMWSGHCALYKAKACTRTQKEICTSNPLVLTERKEYGIRQYRYNADHAHDSCFVLDRYDPLFNLSTLPSRELAPWLAPEVATAATRTVLRTRA
ncbi:hypothetical protein EJB05_27208, partial [Eragrostis curvula]